jgi:flagellar basal-body rod protein FlgG
MNRALFAAANGMAVQQQNLETIAANLSNADVAGFKGAERTAFGTRTILTQGKLERGTGPFDLAIDGPGFFCVENDRGERAYTRDGEFSRAADGTLRNAEGWRLQGVRIADDAISAGVSQDGTVTATFAKGKRVCGHIRLTEFPAPDLLRSAGGTLFFATRESGKAREITAGSENGPNIRFGMLEKSNVTIVEAMMEILTAQRAYEANAKGVQAADEMMRIANNLQRS